MPRSLLLVAALVAPAHADDEGLRPPSSVEADPPPRGPIAAAQRQPFATTRTWGGGLRLTGLSGIGALPGVNFGGELAGHVRREELFAELALGRWRPEKTVVVTTMPERVELGLDVWTLRGGWASKTLPLRAWGLVEVGEYASARGMQGVVTRMMTGETPAERQWHAIGAGLGIAWPMSEYTRLVGVLEVAVPVDREHVMIADSDAYQPDPMAVRSSVGVEIGWR